MPACARLNSGSNSARVKPRFSPVAWISTMSPAPVSTKLASASALDVLLVVEVEHRRVLDHAAGDRGDVVEDRVGLDHPLVQQPAGGQPQRHPGAGDRRGAGAAVGLDDVAVEGDLPLAERLQVGDGAQGAADQPLDLLAAAGLLALGRLAPAAGVGGPGQHAVLGGDPALAAAAQEAAARLVEAGGDQHPGVAEARPGTSPRRSG